MPRKAREDNKTVTNTYHIISRGINKQDIFLDESDKRKFYNIMKDAKSEYQYYLYSFILMNNHIHLTICDNNDQISKIMHKICSVYAMYFNKKYERVGHVFQNRFKSICVDTEGYLLNVIRYIHKNPEKDGICNMDKYKWSSYNDYIYGNTEGITDINFILRLFDEDKISAIKKFTMFNTQVDDDFIDINLEYSNSLNDEEAIRLIKKELAIDNVLLIQNYNLRTRNKIIYKISQINGIYPKQMSRVLGMSERNIQRIIKKHKEIERKL